MFITGIVITMNHAENANILATYKKEGKEKMTETKERVDQKV
jgi:hypothetical protein